MTAAVITSYELPQNTTRATFDTTLKAAFAAAFSGVSGTLVSEVVVNDEFFYKDTGSQYFGLNAAKFFVYQVTLSGEAKGTQNIIITTRYASNNRGENISNQGATLSNIILSVGAATSWNTGTNLPTTSAEAIGGWNWTSSTPYNVAINANRSGGTGNNFLSDSPLGPGNATGTDSSTGAGNPWYGWGAVQVNLPVAPVSLRAIRHPEMCGVYIRTSYSAGFLGYYRPANKPTWWSEATYPYIFLPYNTNFRDLLSYKGVTYSPYGEYGNSSYYTRTLTTNSGFSGSILRSRNPIQNRYDVLPGSYICSPFPAYQGLAGRSSDDLVEIACDATVTPWSTYQVSAGTEEYFILNNRSGGYVESSVNIYGNGLALRSV